MVTFVFDVVGVYDGDINYPDTGKETFTIINLQSAPDRPIVQLITCQKKGEELRDQLKDGNRRVTMELKTI